MWSVEGSDRICLLLPCYNITICSSNKGLSVSHSHHSLTLILSLNKSRVCHNILFNKLAARGVPSYILRILKYWYVGQTFNVGWSNIISDPFTVTNGVRQGSILSPYLFNVLYMDELSDTLNKEQIGCCGGNKIINHLMYADDLVITAPSSAGLNRSTTYLKYVNLLVANIVLNLTH